MIWENIFLKLPEDNNVIYEIALLNLWGTNLSLSLGAQKVAIFFSHQLRNLWELI